MRKAALVLLAVFAFAAYQSATGNGIENNVPTAGARDGKVRPLLGGDAQCVVLGGGGWLPASCGAPDAVDVATNPNQGGQTGDVAGTVGYGATLSAEQVRQLWVQHGGDPAQANTAQAITMAESGRRPGAVNPSNTNGTIDRGLFQMNSIHGGCSTFDLAENVRCAVKLQGSARGWKHWVTYNTGAYRKYL